MSYMEKLSKSLHEEGIEINQQALDEYWKFIYDRHMIWYKRFHLQQPPPWTKDPMFLEYKFTNVYRELDRGTIYLLDNICGVSDPIDQVWNIIVYRMFNRISTFDHLGFKSLDSWRNPKLFRKRFDKLRRLAEGGESLYTDAHMVCAYEHFPGKDKLERFEYIFHGVMEQMETVMSIIERAKSLKTVHSALTSFPGIGPFLAYEMAVDISYCDWNNHGEDEWSNPGPGCQRGLKFIFPGKLSVEDCQWLLKVLRQIQVKEFQRLKLPFEGIAYKGRELTLRNIEHCCCEAFKMFKLKAGTGRPRNKFVPKAETDGWVERLKG